jgi:hypothetical protein
VTELPELIATVGEERFLGGELEFPTNGWPLNKTMAQALGYNADGWPSWINDLAAEIEALPCPADIRMSDPVGRRDGPQVPSHDYRVVFWTEKPSEHIFAALEYDIVGAQDVHEVIEWAEREAGPDDCYTLFVKVEIPWSDDPGRGLVHIAGLDPSVPPEDMTFRRRRPPRRDRELPLDS